MKSGKSGQKAWGTSIGERFFFSLCLPFPSRKGGVFVSAAKILPSSGFFIYGSRDWRLVFPPPNLICFWSNSGNISWYPTRIDVTKGLIKCLASANIVNICTNAWFFLYSNAIKRYRFLVPIFAFPLPFSPPLTQKFILFHSELVKTTWRRAINLQRFWDDVQISVEAVFTQNAFQLNFIWSSAFCSSVPCIFSSFLNWSGNPNTATHCMIRETIYFVHIIYKTSGVLYGWRVGGAQCCFPLFRCTSRAWRSWCWWLRGSFMPGRLSAVSPLKPTDSWESSQMLLRVNPPALLRVSMRTLPNYNAKWSHLLITFYVFARARTFEPSFCGTPIFLLNMKIFNKVLRGVITPFSQCFGQCFSLVTCSSFIHKSEENVRRSAPFPE